METKFEEVTVGEENLSKGEVEGKPLCDNCIKTAYDKATLAERFCIKCEEKLCILCSQAHTVEEEHLVVTLNEQKETQTSKGSEFCINHEEALAELFCASCRKVICSECEKESHSSHNCSRVEDVADLVSKQAEAEYESLYDLNSYFDKEREKLLSEKIKVMKTVKQMEAEIRQRSDEITKLVHSETNTLLKELDVFKKERLEEIEKEMRKMEEHAFTFEKFTEYCDQIKSNTNPRHTCEAEGVLRNILDDLKTRPEGHWKGGLFPVQFSIQKTNIEQVLTSVGKLIITCPYEMRQSCEVELYEKEVCGMAILHNKLYVLSNSIFIRRLQFPFTYAGEIKIPEIISPKDIVSCLYIHDKGADCIWKVSVSDHLVSRWLDKVKQPIAISVTSNAELLLLRNRKPVCLEVYNDHAILMRRLKLPATIPSLNYVCETTCGIYIGLGECDVFKLRTNGSIVGQYSSTYKGIPQCIALSPYHIFLHLGHRRFNEIYVHSLPRKAHKGTISSLTLNIESQHNSLHTYRDRKIPVNSCYIKKTKQLLVLEELSSGKDKTWILSEYDVFAQ